jgi:hypothetical protein
MVGKALLWLWHWQWRHQLNPAALPSPKNAGLLDPDIDVPRLTVTSLNHIMLDQSVVHMFSSTVHGHVCPISGDGRRGGGPCGSLPCQRATCPSGAPVLTLQGSDDAEIVRDGA